MARQRRPGRQNNGPKLTLLGTVITAISVIIAALITGYFTFLANRQPSPSPTPTARIQKTSTPLTALTPQQLYDLLPHLTPIVNDPLVTQDAQNWSTFDSGSVNCNFIDGTYHAIARQIYPVALCFAQARTFNNFAVQVNMEVIKGLAGGLILRAQGTSLNSIMYRPDFAQGFICGGN